MQYEINSGGINVIFETVDLTAVVGDAARIDVGEALNYIKTGQAEVQEVVDSGTAAFNLNAQQKTIAFNNNVTEKTGDFNANAMSKTNAFNSNATDKTNTFNSNATSKTTDFNNNASAKTTAFNNNATAKTGDFDTNATNKTNTFNQNATDKTTAFNNNASSKTTDFNDNATAKTNTFNQNATDKTDAFNLNATNKTGDFNDNYTAKKALIDAEVGNAAASATLAQNWATKTDGTVDGSEYSAKYYASQASSSATTASGSEAAALGYANTAKQWAIGDPSEPTGNSAKYWADTAAATLSSMANKDLSNLSATGEAKLDELSTYKGNFSSSKQYYRGDIVYWNGNSMFMIAKQDNQGQTYPNNIYYWAQIDNDNIVRFKEKSDNVEYPIALTQNNISGGGYSGEVNFTLQNNPTINASTGIISATGGIVTKTQTQGDNSTNAATTAYVDTGLSNKQDTLVSGTNIKTINNESLLGSGNIVIQGGGTTYTAGTGIDITSDVISVDSTVVTTGTNQDITGIKTFIGDKRIKFKQSTSSDKLGFTLYNNLGGEVSAFEYRPNTINGKAFMQLNTAYDSNTYVGFRYYQGKTINIVAPRVATSGTYYIPINLTDGNTTVTANDVGTVDISSLLPTMEAFTAAEVQTIWESV